MSMLMLRPSFVTDYCGLSLAPQDYASLRELAHVGQEALKGVQAKRLESHGTVAAAEFMRLTEHLNIAIVPSHVCTL